MANVLRNWVDRFLGRGEAAVTVPPLDGALKPNNLLEEAGIGLAIPAPDNLVIAGGRLIFSSGTMLLSQPFNAGAGEKLADLSGPITAIAAGENGLLAIAAAGTITFRKGDTEMASGLSAGPQSWAGVTAMAFAPDGSLVIAIGSSKNGVDEWQRDLLDGEQAGSVWRLDPKSGTATQIAARLAYPNGIAFEPNGNIIVSEAWRKRLLRLSPSGQALGQVMEDLPGYPARLSRSDRGGYWLSIFAPRSPLIEFVLREPAYRKAMMAEVDKEFWIAPALRSGYSYHEPMQGGALKQMGILKPWAPTRSYGLVVELAADFTPLRSFHSRAGGARHGITSAVEAEGRLWASAKGGDELVAIDLGTEGK
ncbi:MAG: hypothetical protein RLZZ444_139 [Pseudomonadota bacterium]|jgi:hypothetical protein